MYRHVDGVMSKTYFATETVHSSNTDNSSEFQTVFEPLRPMKKFCVVASDVLTYDITLRYLTMMGQTIVSGYRLSNKHFKLIILLSPETH